MRHKGLFLLLVIFTLLFVVLSRFAYESVARKLDVSLVRAGFEMGEHARRRGKMKIAAANYRGAIKIWEHALQRVGYYPYSGEGYLIACNCWQRLYLSKVAVECYEAGLLGDPYSITLLTGLGACAYRLGEYDKAFTALKKSRSIYPLKKEVRPLWRELSLKWRE